MSTSFGSVESTLGPGRLRRDLVRLVPVAVGCLLLALFAGSGAVSVLVVAVSVLGALVCGLAAGVALVAARSRGLVAASAYGAACTLFAAALVTAL